VVRVRVRLLLLRRYFIMIMMDVTMTVIQCPEQTRDYNDHDEQYSPMLFVDHLHDDNNNEADDDNDNDDDDHDDDQGLGRCCLLEKII
jgi:hypothetical protein